MTLLVILGCGASASGDRAPGRPSQPGHGAPGITNQGQSLSRLRPVGDCADLLAHLRARIVQQMNARLDQNLDAALRNRRGGLPQARHQPVLGQGWNLYTP